jgi:hypothetical protein
MPQEIIFDRQGLIIYAVPEGPGEDFEHTSPPQVRFKIVRPYGEVQLRSNYVRELLIALNTWGDGLAKEKRLL